MGDHASSDELDPDDLDAALRGAYRRGEDSGSSILDRIDALKGAVPRILLREFPDQDTPVVSPDTGEGAGYSGHYQVLGELARGGVGIVLKGRDVDLGRDVALKVLRDCHVENPDVVRRFIEEAQIGGQLQHPGIVPVYELGLKEGDRPFFTMKLIKGKTLAALLTERADPSADRHRVLGIFAQICHTMAYAHARGVVHRDLKPSNVMVGAFGEVQVVDWGFAKILGQGGIEDERRSMAGAAGPDVTEIRTVRTGSEAAESRAGSVMGTPAYMPPEQALGEVDKLDTRSDVFALGAILCEVLTGRPPYVTESGNLLVQAARSELTDAFEHLDRCGADPALIDLTKRCLAPTQPRRPHDAGRLAEEVTGYLDAVEERARTAELEAAKAEVRARGERKARRLVAALAAAVLAAVVLGGGGVIWASAKEQSRAAQAAGVVRGAMEEARGLQGQAMGDRDLWPAARRAAEKAGALAAEHDAGEEPAAGALRLLDQIEEKADRAGRNAALIARLAGIRGTRGDRLGYKAADDAYRDAFAGFGIEDDPESASGRLLQTGIGDELAAYLDDWLWLRGLVGLPSGPILEVAGRVDGDHWRSRLRRAAADRSREEILRTADAMLPEDLRRGHLPNLLALHLSSVGERDRAIEVLRAAQALRPDDFWLNFQLGLELTLLAPPAWEEGVGFFRVALAADPESVEVRHQLGIALFKMGRHEESIRVFTDLLDAHPDYLHAWDHVIEAHETGGTVDDAIARWERAPADWREHYRLGRAFEVKGEWERVLECYDRALALEESAFLHTRMGQARQYAGDLEGALDSHRRALVLDPGHAEAQAGITRVHFQRFDREGALRESRRVIEMDPYDPFAYDVHGVILSWLGRHDEALETHRKALVLKPDHIVARNHLAMDLWRRGDLAAAAAAFEAATRMPDRYAEGRFWLNIRTERDPEGGPPTRHPVLGAQSARARAFHLLGIVYLYQGRVGDAVEACRENVALVRDTPDHVFLRTNLVMLLRSAGQWEETVRQARAVLARSPPAPVARRLRRDLFWALLGAGRYEEGKRLIAVIGPELVRPETPADLRRRHEEVCARLPELARSVPEMIDGTFEWASPEEKLKAAWLLGQLAWYGHSARLFESAFSERPDLVESLGPWPDPEPWGGEAARFLVMAGLGEGRDAAILDPEDAVRWRRAARRWLGEACRSFLEPGEDGGEERHRLVVRRLGQILDRWEFAPVREPANLSRLPAEEERDWQDFWERVRAAHARALAALGGRGEGDPK